MVNGETKLFSLSGVLLKLLLVQAIMSQVTHYYEDENVRFYQVTLIPSEGVLINKNASQMTFNKPTDYLDNVVNAELVLAGFSLQNELNLQYQAQIRYSLGNFEIKVQAYNETSFEYISFFAVMFRAPAQSYFQARSICHQCSILAQNPNKNRSQLINVSVTTNKTANGLYSIKPYLRSMKIREGGNGYTRLRVFFSSWNTYSTKITLVIQTYQSIVTEACLTVVVLATSVVGTANYTYFQKDYTIRQFAAASVKNFDKNFGIPSATYGPIFNQKCVIGYSNLYFRDGIKQIYFDITKTGITSIVQNTPQYFVADMNIFCITRFKSCNNNQGIQTGIQECLNCSVMIKNCAFCRTQSECTQCKTGYFIDTNKKCCPILLRNCTTCTLGDLCTQCADSFYISENGICVACTDSVAKCSLCRNSTFCYNCVDGYSLTNKRLCTKIQTSNSTNATNSTTGNNPTENTTNNSNINNNTNNNTDDNSDKPKPQSSDGLSLPMILFLACAAISILLLFIIVALCIKLKKKNQSQLAVLTRTHPPSSLQNHNRMTEHENLNNAGTDLIHEGQPNLPSSMQIRNGSKLNPYPSTYEPTHKAVNKESKSTKEYLSIISMRVKSNQIRSNQLSLKNDLQSELQSQRGLKGKNIGFLPQVSKETLKFGGSIHLKTDQHKK